jgi:hypothetical protein
MKKEANQINKKSNKLTALTDGSDDKVEILCIVFFEQG